MDAIAVLQRLGNGTLIDSLGEALTEVSQQVVDTGNPGGVTVSFKISQPTSGEPTIVVLESVRRTLPARKSRGAFFFAQDGVLTREDPRQVKMELREVEKEPEVRPVEDDDAIIREIG